MPLRMLLLAGLLAGCGGAVAPARPAAPEACLLGDGAGAGSGELSAAAAEADTGFLSPARLRTPIGLDCAGRPVARRASSWSRDSSARNWTLVLEAPADLAATWRAAVPAAVLRAAGVSSVVPLDERRLVVSFHQPHATVPLVFADPALAAAGEAGEADEGPVRLGPLTGDLRDAVDRGTDLVLTADPAVLEYAASRSGYTVHPLPWSRTYLLLAPAGDSALRFELRDTAGFRADLARDAVRVDARGAAPPFWWDTVDCARSRSPASRPAGPRVVIHPAADPVARSLAERLVAMSRTPDLVARSASPAELDAALSSGAAAGFVVPVPRVPAVLCRERAGWPAGWEALALVDTRLTAVLRVGAPAVHVEYDGGVVPVERR